MTAAPAGSPTPGPWPVETVRPALAPGRWRSIPGTERLPGNLLAFATGNGEVLILRHPGISCVTQHDIDAAVDAAVYDHATGRVTPTTLSVDLPWSYAATALPDGRVFVAGGYDPPDFEAPSRRAQLWDPETKRWSSLPPIEVSIQYPAAAALSDGRVLLVGTDDVSVVAIYDPSREQWREVSTPAEVLGTISSLQTLMDGPTLAIDGEGRSGSFDPGSLTWAPGPAMPFARVFPLLDGTLLGYGGPEIQRFDPETGSWSVVGRLALGSSDPSRDPAITLLPDGRLFLAGGTEVRSDDAVELTRSAVVFDPDTGITTALAPLPTYRDAASAAALPDGSVLIAGGADEWGDEIDQCAPPEDRLILWTE